mgnify:FL=1
MAWFSQFSEYYYIIFILQGICAFHSIRRGTQSKWIWIIVFLPLIGSLAYIFTEIIQKRQVAVVQENLVSFVNPSGRIKKLERNLKFSDTIANRIYLADAYLAAGQYDEAASLYESCLNHSFTSGDEVVKNLIQAYFYLGRFESILQVAPKVANDMTFTKSPAGLMYAIALEKCGQAALAEKEYIRLNARFSNYEARYKYGLFLQGAGRHDEAKKIFQTMIEESEHMTRSELGESVQWIKKAGQELNPNVQ